MDNEALPDQEPKVSQTSPTSMSQESKHYTLHLAFQEMRHP